MPPAMWSLEKFRPSPNRTKELLSQLRLRTPAGTSREGPTSGGGTVETLNVGAGQPVSSGRLMSTTCKDWFSAKMVSVGR
nr:unnamed protein product [Digitaria exilis]